MRERERSVRDRDSAVSCGNERRRELPCVWRQIELNPPRAISRAAKSGSTVDMAQFRASFKVDFLDERATRHQWLRDSVTVEPL